MSKDTSDTAPTEYVQQGFRIRQATIQDAPHLFSLINRLMTETDGYLAKKTSYSSERLEQFLMNLGSDNLLLVAEVNNELIGWVGVNRNLPQFRQHTSTLLIGVDPYFQGQGIGTKLLNSIEEEARKIGIEKIELGVREDNESARRFYMLHGFEQEGSLRRSVKQNDTYIDEILMGKMLV